MKETEGLWLLLLQHCSCTVRIKQITIEHNIINYSYSYVFRTYGVIIRLILEPINLLAPVLHLIQINHQPDATIFQFIILTFVYSSTCFGRFLAHRRELNDCSGSLWFYLRIVVTTNTARLSPRYEGKTRGCHCSH